MSETIKTFDKYARCYDLLYADKDYDAECDLIEEIFRRHGKTVEDILDVGCGTGNHSIQLSQRGYRVAGVDPAPEMIKLFEKKNKSDNILIDESKAKDFWFSERKFDAAICMFSTLNYITHPDEIIESLKNIHNHLKTGGLFIFDFWYGPAVQHIRPSEKHKIVTEGKKTIIRVVTPEIHAGASIQESHYRLIVLHNGCIVDDFEETHVLRFFFPNEITRFLHKSGFKILTFSEFMKLDSPPTKETWDAMIVAEAI